jgi:DNA-binding NtrC family response regulator
LRDEGHHVRIAENASEARDLRTNSDPDLVLLDIWMPDTDGVTLLKEWASTGQLTMPVVMMSGHGTIDTAVEATRIGAYAFLEKPIALQKLLSTVGSALAHGHGRSQRSPTFATIGKSAAAEQLRRQIENVRQLRSSVLFVAEAGAGADQCARLLQQSEAPWIEISGARQFDKFRHELAGLSAQRVVYVHDVHELSLEQQRVLLSMFEVFDRSGVRLLSSTSTSLPDRIADGAFDSRLYSVLAGTIVRVPCLRERSEDVPELVDLLLARSIESRETPPHTFSMAALNMLRNYHWPGNLVQLQSVVQTCAQLASGSEIDTADVTNALAVLDAPLPVTHDPLILDRDLRAARDDFERMYFEFHLSRGDGNMSRVANRVGLERTHLYRKLKQLGIKLPRRSEE